MSQDSEREFDSCGSVERTVRGGSLTLRVNTFVVGNTRT